MVEKTSVKLCSLEYCDNKALGRGYCGSHYAQVYRYGIEPRPVGAHWVKDEKCEVPHCDRAVTRQSRLCIPCYKKLARYELTVDELVALPSECEVCGSADRIHVDHDHSTGKFRGVLCGSCNTALGLVRESPERLLNLAKYIKDKNGY